MTRREMIAAAMTFLVAACATGVADPLIVDPQPVVDAGMDASMSSDSGTDGDASNDGGASGDGIPLGAVIYTFATACPVGYTLFTEGVGRFPLGSETNVLSTSSATPFAHLEEPTHQHRVTGSIPTVDRDFIAFATSNGGQADGADPSFDVESTASTLGLGYVELLACRKSVAPPMGAPSLPTGAVIPFATDACPSGFAPYAPANGRFVEGMPISGTNEITLGGSPMTVSESFSHGHTLIATLNVGEGPDRENDTGCCARWYARPGAHPFTAPAATVSTTLPTVRLLYCERM